MSKAIRLPSALLPFALLTSLLGAARGAPDAPAWLQHRLATATPGDTLDVSEFADSVPSLPKLSVTRTWTGGALLFSDSPEYIPAPGVLYADTLPPGPARLFLYHVNGTRAAGAPKSLKLSVVVEPADPGRPGAVILRRRNVHGPSTSYSSIGRFAAYDDLSLPDAPVSIPVTGPTLLDPSLETRLLSATIPEPLVQAQYDLEVTGAPLRFTFVALEPARDTLAAYTTLAPLPREEWSPGVYKHDRGTFATAAGKDIALTSGAYSTVTGMMHLRLAGGINDTAGADAFAGEGDSPGYDAILSIPSRLRGNFGVFYTIRLRAINPDGRRLAILVNPRGGAFAGAVDNSESLTGSGPVLTPASGMLSAPGQAALLGRWDPRRTPDFTLLWTPPGASSLPVEFLLVPYPEPGDANGSGSVDIADAVLTARFVSGFLYPTIRQIAAADVVPADAPDGAITFADVAWILRRAASLE